MNDDRDAEAIAEAATRPTTRFLPLKAQEQLDMQSLHRDRSRLLGMRTMLMNKLPARSCWSAVLSSRKAAASSRRQSEFL